MSLMIKQMSLRLDKRLLISPSTVIFACPVWRGSRYSLFSGKAFEGVANRRLLLSNEKSGKDSRIQG